MVFGLGESAHRELSVGQLSSMLHEGQAIVIDVREIDEFATGHIPGAINMPLSAFRVSNLPDRQGKTLVLSCLGGKRSGMALDKCSAAQAQVDTHLAGGFRAWQAAGLPIER